MSNQTTGTTKTLKQWSAAGWKVRKGSKARTFNEQGVAMFDKDQVVRPPWHNRPRCRGDSDYDMEDDFEQAFAYGISQWGGG